MVLGIYFLVMYKMNNILKNYRPLCNIIKPNNNYNYFHVMALFNLIEGGRIEGDITITNKRLIMEYKTKRGNKLREEYKNEN